MDPVENRAMEHRIRCFRSLWVRIQFCFRFAEGFIRWLLMTSQGFKFFNPPARSPNRRSSEGDRSINEGALKEQSVCFESKSAVGDTENCRFLSNGTEKIKVPMNLIATQQWAGISGLLIWNGSYLSIAAHLPTNFLFCNQKSSESFGT